MDKLMQKKDYKQIEKKLAGIINLVKNSVLF